MNSIIITPNKVTDLAIYSKSKANKTTANPKPSKGTKNNKSDNIPNTADSLATDQKRKDFELNKDRITFYFPYWTFIALGLGDFILFIFHIFGNPHTMSLAIPLTTYIAGFLTPKLKTKK
jgi:hypothetical protein